MLDCLQIAEGAGVELRRRGGKYWARCPFHAERTPSFAIYPEGRGWYCFSCHRGGDAAALYQALYNVPIRDALRAVGKEESVTPVRSAGEELRRKAERWRAAQWDAACHALHEANRALALCQTDSDALWNAVSQRENAALTLDELQNATPRELVARMKGEHTANERMGRTGA